MLLWLHAENRHESDGKKKTIFKQYKCLKNFDFELPRHFNIAILAPKIAIKHQ